MVLQMEYQQHTATIVTSPQHICMILANEPVLSVNTDLMYKASMTAAQSHYHSCTVPVSKVLTQRSQTYEVFTESYHVSEVQKVLRQSQTWPVKSKLEFNVSSGNPRQAQNLSIDSHRGVRGTISRYLNDGSPNPVYVVEWAGGLQVYFITGGALSVTIASFLIFWLHKRTTP